MRTQLLSLSTSLLRKTNYGAGLTFSGLRELKSSVLDSPPFKNHLGECVRAIHHVGSCKGVCGGKDGGPFHHSRNAALKLKANDVFCGMAKGCKFVSDRAVSEKDGNVDESASHSKDFIIQFQDADVDRNSVLEPLQSDALEASDLGVSNDLPDMSRTVYNLAPYVHQSETLQNLVKLGVNLTKVEKVKGIASMLVMSDFDRDILPYLRHLVRVGVTPDKLGHILTVNPMILTEYLDHLEQRVGYMMSKDFTMHDVASIYSRAPVVIRMDPAMLDNKLSFLQQAFDLTGQEVRHVVMTFPKILPWKKEKISNVRLTLKEFMGFEDDDLKLMLLREPKLFTSNVHHVQKVFDYLHNSMLVPHSLLVKWPSCLRSRLHRLRERHLFLLHLGRAQYDWRKENYVSLKALLGCMDDVFCSDVAKSTEEEFFAFQKTL